MPVSGPPLFYSSILIVVYTVEPLKIRANRERLTYITYILDAQRITDTITLFEVVKNIIFHHELVLNVSAPNEGRGFFY